MIKNLDINSDFYLINISDKRETKKEKLKFVANLRIIVVYILNKITSTAYEPPCP